MGVVVGKVMPLPRGAYDPAALYDILDIVTTDTKAWIAKQSGITNIEPSEENSDYWMLLLHGASSAEQLAYSNDELAATNLKEAIDEIIENGINKIPDGVVYVDEEEGEETGELIPLDADTLDGQGIEYFATAEEVSEVKQGIANLDGSELIYGSLLDTALTLENGVYNFKLIGSSYTGDDLPDVNYAYGQAMVFVRGTGANKNNTVILWGGTDSALTRTPKINHYNGSAWAGWKSFSPSWELIGSVTGTTEISFNLANYSEVLMYANIPNMGGVTINAITGNWYYSGHYKSTSDNSSMCSRLTDTGAYLVSASYNGSDYTSSTTFRVYGRRA